MHRREEELAPDEQLEVERLSVQVLSMYSDSRRRFGTRRRTRFNQSSSHYIASRDFCGSEANFGQVPFFTHADDGDSDC